MSRFELYNMLSERNDENLTSVLYDFHDLFKCESTLGSAKKKLYINSRIAQHLYPKHQKKKTNWDATLSCNTMYKCGRGSRVRAQTIFYIYFRNGFGNNLWKPFSYIYKQKWEQTVLPPKCHNEKWMHSIFREIFKVARSGERKGLRVNHFDDDNINTEQTKMSHFTDIVSHTKYISMQRSWRNFSRPIALQTTSLISIYL